jgi:hypothetical protein
MVVNLYYELHLVMFTPLFHSSHKIDFSEHGINVEIARTQPNHYIIKAVNFCKVC